VDGQVRGLELRMKLVEGMEVKGIGRSKGSGILGEVSLCSREVMDCNQIARNQEFGLSTLHTMAKV
jgi:hypothetical protein